jgi:hypothetical protein
MAVHVLIRVDMNCDEERRLLRLHNQAKLAVDRTIEELLQGGGPDFSVVYDIRRHAAKKARGEFELARLAYEAHISDHCCEPGSLVGAYVGQCSSVTTEQQHQSPVHGYSRA